MAGTPQGKARPKFCKIRERTIAYTPKQTIQYEQKIKTSYKDVKGVKFPKGTPLKVDITAFFDIPSYKAKWIKELMLEERILPTKKPDSDNIIKIILDGLNGVAYFDDCQVCDIIFAKKVFKYTKNLSSN